MAEIRFAILGAQSTWHSQALERALIRSGVAPIFCDPLQLEAQLGKAASVRSGGVPLSEMDAILVRDVPGGSLEQVIFRMDALHQLENGGVRVINSPYAIEKMVDKYYTLSLLQGAGLPVPETRVVEDYSLAQAAFRDLGGDVVVKPLFGSRGAGMVRVTDEETAGRVFKALQLGGYVYYLQRFVPHGNCDLRVLVSGGECIAAMERVADGWKNNISAGGQARPFALSPEVRQASLLAAETLKADYCGVDLLYSEAGQLFMLEVNSMPAWKGLQQVTPFDISARIVQDCLAGLRS